MGTNNTYYITPDDASVQDMLSSVADGRALDDPDRPTLMNGDYSLRSSREMEELFVYAPRAYENSQKIADMIDLEIEYGSYKIPRFPLSHEETMAYKAYEEETRSASPMSAEILDLLDPEEWFLRKICIDGLSFRYGFTLDEASKNILISKKVVSDSIKKLSEMSIEELHDLSSSHYTEAKIQFIAKLRDNEKSILERLEYELLVVDLMGFNGYFCIVADFIQYGKKNGIPV